MNDPEVQWTSPAPLWDGLSDLGPETRQFFRRPAILRFATDNFMGDMASVLQTKPARLQEFRARPETWRAPESVPRVESYERWSKLAQKLQRARLLAQVSTSDRPPIAPRVSEALQPLKLFQPAHQRYYLISAGLVCRIPGQPDRHLESSNQERVTFVVRKVVPDGNASILDSNEESWAEYAFTGDGWLRTNDVHTLAAGEEQIPLFAVSYMQDDGHRRRVLAGLIPVGKRETYIAAPERAEDTQAADPGRSDMPDPRKLLFTAQFTEPWKRLIERTFAWRGMKSPAGPPLTNDNPLSGGALDRSIKDSREQMQTTSWYALLDFANLLRQYIPNVWRSMTGQPLPAPLTQHESDLLSALSNTIVSDGNAGELVQKSGYFSSDVARNLQAALQKIQGGLEFNQAKADDIERKLETVVTPYDRGASAKTGDWPDFLFPLADPVLDGPLPPQQPAAKQAASVLSGALDRVDGLLDLIVAALPADVKESMPAPLIAAQPTMGMNRPAYFVIRCVFERPQCGPLHSTLISDATEPFLLAGFFDPDAPARPIRIGLPVDTTPAGLRKFDKNTAFMMSDVLCGQVDRAKALGLGDLVRSVLPWPLHKDLEVPDTGPCKDEDGLSIGMICSLSIPIITICALILLMIIVNLLDIIFRWAPYFILCLPVPKFEAKQASGT